ncbi:MAG: hypothetical protein WCV41_04430, partial [Patescibacteria group bacterium]
FATGSFTTPSHQYPAVDFTWSPLSPKALDDVFFTNASVTYGGSLIRNSYWEFTGALPNSSTTPNPGPVQFQGEGNKNVNLGITDTDGYTCTSTKTITTKMSLPIWQEIKPE